MKIGEHRTKTVHILEYASAVDHSVEMGSRQCRIEEPSVDMASSIFVGARHGLG